VSRLSGRSDLISEPAKKMRHHILHPIKEQGYMGDHQSHAGHRFAALSTKARIAATDPPPDIAGLNHRAQAAALTLGPQLRCVDPRPKIVALTTGDRRGC